MGRSSTAVKARDMRKNYQTLLRRSPREFQKAYLAYNLRQRYIFLTRTSRNNSRQGEAVAPVVLVPISVRKDLVSNLQEEFFPALRQKIRALGALCDFNLATEHFKFPLQPALKIMEEIDQMTASLVDSVVQLQEKLEGPESMLAAIPADTGDMSVSTESTSSLPWIMTMYYLDILFETLDDNFDLEPPFGPAKDWFENTLRLDHEFDIDSRLFGESSHAMHRNQWSLMASVMSDRVLYSGQLSTRKPYDGNDLNPHQQQQRQLIFQHLTTIFKLSRLLLDKFSKTTNVDMLFLCEMSGTQLESLNHHTGIYSVDQYILENGEDADESVFEIRISRFFHLGARPPQFLLNHRTPKSPGRTLLQEIDKVFGGIFEVLNEHFDQLLLSATSSSSINEQSIQKSRNWCKMWKVSYNMAVMNYLKTYQAAYGSQFDNSWFHEETYFGSNLE